MVDVDKTYQNRGSNDNTSKSTCQIWILYKFTDIVMVHLWNHLLHLLSFYWHGTCSRRQKSTAAGPVGWGIKKMETQLHQVKSPEWIKWCIKIKYHFYGVTLHMTSQGHQYLPWGRYSLLAIQMIFLESHESFEWCKDLACASLPSFFIEKGSVTSVKKSLLS